MDNSCSVVGGDKVTCNHSESMFWGVVWQGCIGPQLLVSNANERSTFDFISDEERDVFSFLVVRQQVIIGFDLLKDFCKHL